LGLAIVKRLGNLLDHRVDVRSTPGKGTGFSIEVPQAQACASPPERVPSSVNDVDLSAHNVLVIEDETSVRNAVVRFLKFKGIEVNVVATGDEALALIDQQQFRPDLVLSDFNLRGSTDGLESIKALRMVLGWNVPAIIMTGDIRSETVNTINAHDISVLIKPFLTDELLQHMTRLHRGPESHDPI
jgi:CheY-like chemotaxis protein